MSIQVSSPGTSGRSVVSRTDSISEVPSIEAVLFDLDGVLVDTEPIWERVRRAFAEQRGARWSSEMRARISSLTPT